MSAAPCRADIAPNRYWVERTDVMEKALRSMKRSCAIAALAKILYNAPDEKIAEKLHVTLAEAFHLSSIGISQLRHPSRSIELGDVSIEADQGALVIDKGLRSLLVDWRMEEMFGTRCPECQIPLEAPFGIGWGPRRAAGRPGRPRRFCSGACRQKAYRRRRRSALDGKSEEADVRETPE